MSGRDLYHAHQIMMRNLIEHQQDGTAPISFMRAVIANRTEGGPLTGISTGWTPVPAGDFEAALLLPARLSRREALACARAIIKRLVRTPDNHFRCPDDFEQELVSDALAVAAGSDTPWLQADVDIPF